MKHLEQMKKTTCFHNRVKKPHIKKQADIEYKASRYNEITQGDLVLNLDTLIGDFFTAYSQYLQNPSPANSGELQKLVSSECMESILNEKTDDKISDLADFISKLDGQSGTLFMQNGNANNYGYTFRAN